ncbi:WhiB family transcriptional regulator [Kocuria soli]|uniref:WhiB family transcriptional regulator n=1 Tax=Kocuria soli TaxID=2485125 RepID=UPI0013150D9A|nr:WhiB family transcriptional regulator [Kocuria soli]
MSGGHDRLLRKLEEIQRQAPQAIPCRSSNSTAWITGTPQDTWYAQARCQSCPARIACATYAVDAREPAGVWGGLTPKERASLTTQRRRAELTKKEAAA